MILQAEVREEANYVPQHKLRLVFFFSAMRHFCEFQRALGRRVICRTPRYPRFPDIGLPGMNGYEVARQLRSEPVGSRVKVIAVTGYGQPEDRQRTLQSGFDFHLFNPIDAEQCPGLSPRAIMSHWAAIKPSAVRSYTSRILYSVRDKLCDAEALLLEEGRVAD